MRNIRYLVSFDLYGLTLVSLSNYLTEEGSEYLGAAPKSIDRLVWSKSWKKELKTEFHILEFGTTKYFLTLNEANSVHCTMKGELFAVSFSLCRQRLFIPLTTILRCKLLSKSKLVPELTYQAMKEIRECT
jgi:hypothetical protein